jgi:hypothetical protein
VLVVPDPTAGLDDNQVEPQGQVRERYAIGQCAAVEQAVRGGADSKTLAGVNGLLGESEGTIGAPANLDRHERTRRTWIDGDQVELVPTDMDVPAEDRPAGRHQAIRDLLFGGVTQPLGVGAHRRTVAIADRPRLIE